MKFSSINPYDGLILAQFEAENDKIIEQKINLAHTTFNLWKSLSIEERCKYVLDFSKSLEKNKLKNAEIITNEMGKVLSESVSEIEKCISSIQYFVDNAKTILSNVEVQNKASKSYLSYEPSGAILAIMPWNFPFWQVLRFAIPTLLSGNVVLLKHAPNVWMSANSIENLFHECGFPKGAFQHLSIGHEKVEKIISSNFVTGVTLTGSSKAGAAVASLAGKYLKKSVLELGGSDPFLVLKDANLEKAAIMAVKSRFQNAGQTCIAAKRWIVEKAIYDDFKDLVIQEIDKIKIGNPLLPNINMGPLARPDLAENVELQTNQLKNLGAKGIIPLKRDQNFLNASLYETSKDISNKFSEELFGPVACLTKVLDENEALTVANDTNFGLGASIWSNDIEKAQKLGRNISSGSIYINSLVKSDPSLAFGGIKNSGYGREMGSYGFNEFCNIKSYWIENPIL